jgi:hypothetical protein
MISEKVKEHSFRRMEAFTKASGIMIDRMEKEHSQQTKESPNVLM